MIGGGLKSVEGFMVMLVDRTRGVVAPCLRPFLKSDLRNMFVDIPYGAVAPGLKSV